MKTDIASLLALAEQLAKSSLMPESLKGKPADILTTMLAGEELGLEPMQAIRSIVVIKGRPTMAADLIIGQCLKHRDVCEYFRVAESTPEIATYVTKRAGSEPTTLSYTIADAKRAQLTNNPTWGKYPAQMLRARCGSALARAVYPDLVLGVYETDEGREIAASDDKPGIPLAETVEKKMSTEVAEIINKINHAQNEEELKAVLATAASLTDEEKAQIRPLYRDKTKTLRGTT